MRCNQLLVILSLAASAAIAEPLPIERGSEDLRRVPSLSQPFTVLDQLLLSLERRAAVVAKDIRPQKSEFRPSRMLDVSSSVSFSSDINRVLVEFRVPVTGIDDPWREVCSKHLQQAVTFGLQLPYSEHWKSKNFNITATGFFGDFLGPRLTTPAQLQSYKAFSDSIVVELLFLVESGERQKPLKYFRACLWDNKTSKSSFVDHKY